MDINALLNADVGDPSIPKSDPAGGHKSPRALRDVFLRRPSDRHSPTTQTSPTTWANNNNNNNDQPPPQLPSLGLGHPFHLSFSNPRADSPPPPIPPAQPHRKESVLQTESPELESLRSQHYAASDGDGAGRTCDCLYVTASLLSKLSEGKAHGDLTPTSVMLSNFRDTLGLCSTITNCHCCTSMRDNTMLLATVACYLGKICRRVSARYESLRRAHMKRRPLSPSLAGECAWNALAYHGLSNVWFSTYHVQDDAERLEAWRSIMSVHIKDFWELLTILKGKSAQNSGSLAMLAGAKAEARKLALILEQHLPD